ncbi:MAG: HlyD family efflux transporter periplasmic adaptor subunit, partial [Pirellulales bacterium]|nr:HlyD family efflux transporter periplasmic adaptor subunit [Pirellulales bacterium]
MSVLSHKTTGRIVRLSIFALVVVGIASAAVHGVSLLNGNGDNGASSVMMATVEQGPFVYDVVVAGQIESSVNFDVRCEVKSKGAGGTEILKIVDEGTFVKKGDIICELDSSALVDELTTQRITVARSKADLIQAQSLLAAAKSAHKEYEVGEFVELLAGLESEQFIKQEDLRRAEEYYDYSKRLAAKGYVTSRQLEADRFAVERARKELHAAKTKLTVLKDYKRAERLQQLAKEVEAAEAVLQAMSDSHPLEQRKLKDIQEQIDKCTIRAPQDGQVVYANETDRRGNSEVIIEQGTAVRERQVIVRLPNPKYMQVAAKIPESRVQRIKPGMDATIRLDARRNEPMRGTVETVGSFPLPSAWYKSGVKEYPAVVKIHDPPPQLKTGFRAQVRVHALAMDEALTLPVQAVLQRGRQYFVVLPNGSDWRSHEVTVGPSNEKFVVIE